MSSQPASSSHSSAQCRDQPHGAGYREDDDPEDWWGTVEAADDDECSPTNPPSTGFEHDQDLRRRVSEPTQNDRHEWIAHEVLMDGVQFFCPIALDEHDELVYQSEPCEWVPRTSSISGIGEYAVKDAPRRYNEKHGYIAFGGLLEERSTENLVDVVEAIIAGLDRALPKRKVRRYRRFTKEEKSRNQHDKAIVAAILKDLDDSLPETDLEDARPSTN
jgi:hypothetical protein